MSGLEPKLQVVDNHLYFEYFGNSANGTWQVYTGASGVDGNDWLSSQRTVTKGRYDVEQARNIQVVGSKVYYAFPMKDASGRWQLWVASSNTDGSSWRARQETKTGGFIPSFQVVGKKIYYIFLSGADKDQVNGGYINDVVIARSNLDGSGWHEIHRIHGAAWYLIAELAVNDGTIYFSFSKGDSDGDAHLWTGSVATDGSAFQEHQRTFGVGNATPAGIQVVGRKVLYAFSVTDEPAKSMLRFGFMGMSFLTASTDLNGSHWVQQRRIVGDVDDYLTGYKMLDEVGGKEYFDVNKMSYKKTSGRIVRQEYGMLAYSGSNVLNKGDSFGIGMSAGGSVSGFVNAGEDYLYRGAAPKDTAGAMVQRKLKPGWHFVVVTYDGRTLRLYIDAKLALQSRYGKRPAANPFPLVIGDGFVGKVAHLMLFDRPLDRRQISSVAQQYKGASCKSIPR